MKLSIPILALGLLLFLLPGFQTFLESHGVNLPF